MTLPENRDARKFDIEADHLSNLLQSDTKATIEKLRNEQDALDHLESRYPKAWSKDPVKCFYNAFSKILDTFSDFKYKLELIDDNYHIDFMNIFIRITNWTLRPWIETPDILADWLFDRYHLTHNLDSRYYSIPPVVFIDLGRLSKANEFQYFKLNVNGSRLAMNAGSCSAISVADADDYVQKMIHILNWMLKNQFVTDNRLA